MRVTAEFLNTDAVEVTLTVTMKMGDWKELRAQLPTAYPGGYFGDRIFDAVQKLESRVQTSAQENT